MSINKSKEHDPRMWNRWERAGALGTYPPASVSKIGSEAHREISPPITERLPSVRIGDAEVSLVKPPFDLVNALIWINSNHNLYPLAGNRFRDSRDALNFVTRLYEAGAKHVGIDKKSIRDDVQTLYAEGGPHADVLVVELPPNDPEGRRKIMQIAKEEFDREIQRREELKIGLDDEEWLEYYSFEGVINTYNPSYISFWWD